MSDVPWYNMNVSHEAPNSSKVYSSVTQLPAEKVTIVVKCAGLVLIAMFGVFGNILTLVAIRKTPSLRTKSNMLLAALAAAHLYMSAIQTPYFTVFNLWVYVFADSSCYYIKAITIMYPIPKIVAHTIYVHLIAIAVDRYVAILYPFQYEVKMTVTVIKLLIGGSYAFGFVVAAIYFSYIQYVDWNTCGIPYSTVMTAVIDAGMYIAVAVVTILVYFRILLIALQHRAKIDTVTVISHDAPSRIHTIQDARSGDSTVVPRGEQEKPKIKKVVSEFKAAGMTAVLVCAYTLPLLPYEIGRIMQACGNLQPYTSKLIDVGGALGTINTGFDWMIYGIMNRTFRRAFLRVLKIKAYDINDD